jgi:signal transduction histidine kinase
VTAGAVTTVTAGTRTGRALAGLVRRMRADGMLMGGRPGPVRLSMRWAGVFLYAVACVLATPAAHRGVAAGVAVAGIAAVLTGLAPERYRVFRTAGVLGYGATGFAMILVARQPLGYVAPLLALFWAVVRLGPVAAPWLAALFGAGMVGVGWLVGGPGGAAGMFGGSCGAAVLGYSIRSARHRAEQAERLLASERRAREATARAGVLAERQRLAREIHDILAHTLSAQVVQLEGARLLLRRLAGGEEVLARVEQAQRLARDGLHETRRALESLRGHLAPLEVALPKLAADSGASYAVHGDVRELGPEASLAFHRTVQEALTNVRKHAPGATARVTLRYLPAGCEVEITDTGRAGAEPAELAVAGAGYGLAGMRERAELLGGTFEAGPYRPDGKGFRVWLRIPE